MKKLLFLCLSLVSGLVYTQETILTKSNPQTSNISITVETFNKGYVLSDLIINIPLPSTNNIQIIEDVKINNSIIVEDKINNFKYASFIYNSNNSPKKNESLKSVVTYKATIYDQIYDLSKVKKIEAYNIDSEIFKKYTIDNLPFIDTGNTELKKISDQLWRLSNENILVYAKLVYEYIPKNYQYKNQNTGLHPLNELISADGGDCGNLSSINITLLRMKKIPARHVISIRANSSYHVWAEFYLENIGWIPSDVTFKLLLPENNYFGKIDKDMNGIILNKDVNLSLILGEKGSFNLPLFQTYGYWYWYTAGSGSLDSIYSIADK